MNKIPILLAILALCNGVCTPVAQVVAAEEQQQQREIKSTVANEVLSQYIKFTELSINESGVKFIFNSSKIPTIGVRNFYLASYNHEKVPMSYADAHLSELGTLPNDEIKKDWASVVVHAIGTLRMGASITGGSSSSAKYLTNHPGIMYYAAEIYDETVDDFYWVRGKISYRKQMYYDAAPTKMVLDCVGGIAGGKYVFQRTVSGLPNDVFVPWSTELHETLVNDLSNLEGKILAWTGDTTEKAEYLAELARIRSVSEDADDTNGLRTEVARLEELLNKRIQEIEEAGSGNGDGSGGNDDKPTTGDGDGSGEGGDNTGDGDDSDNNPGTDDDKKPDGDNDNNGGEGSEDGQGSGDGNDGNEGGDSGNGSDGSDNDNSDNKNPETGENNPSDREPETGEDASDEGKTEGNNPIISGNGTARPNKEPSSSGSNLNLGQGLGESNKAQDLGVKKPTNNTLATAVRPVVAQNVYNTVKNDQRSVEDDAQENVSDQKEELSLETPILTQDKIDEGRSLLPIALAILSLGLASTWGIWFFVFKRKKNEDGSEARRF